MTETPDPIAQAENFSRQGADAWNRGHMLDAVNAFARAALLNPQRPDYHMNLGVCLRKTGRVEASIASYKRAVFLTPNDPVLLSNMGNSYRDLGLLEEAEFYLRRAHELSPHTQSFYYNLALVIRDRRRHREARQMMVEILNRDPNNADVAWDMALTDLYLLDYQTGWRSYETRWRLERAAARSFPGIQWRPGMPLQDRTLLIVAEQGFGDSLQFARFLPFLVQQGARLVVECQPELQDLLGNIPGVVQTLPKHSPPPPYDYWLPIMSLAWLLGVRYENIPNQVPYLSPPPSRQFDLPRLPGVKKNVGLIWAGKTTPRDRSWPLTNLMPLLENPQLAFWSLQMGDRANDLGALGVGALVRDLRPYISTFADTAAIMNSLDLIITIDTSACHLAGALGRPTWVLLRYVSDWRWLDEPSDSAWYPTLRLFRQPNPQDFTTPVEQVCRALTELLDQS